MGRSACALLFAAVLYVGCGGVREVQTQPPRPAVAVSDTAAASDRIALTVTFAVGDDLPPEVTALRLRVAALWLHRDDEGWQKRPVSRSIVESGGPPVRLLSADVPRRRYDSLAVVLADPFVTFGPNAGGPLTVADSGVVRLPLTLDIRERSHVEFHLHLDPGLARDSTGAWHFQPRLSAHR